MKNIRIFKTKIFIASCFILTAIAMMPVVLIFFYLIREGLGRMDFAFFSEIQPAPGPEKGGGANALIGTFLLITTSTLIALPISILSAIHLAFNKRVKTTEFIEVAANVLQSVPAIVIGLIVYTWIVRTTGRFSMISGAIALSIIMIPYITINVTEVIRLIPYNIIEAGYAMGGSFFSVIVRIIIPSAIPGIITGTIVALARVAGEAAPLFLTAFGNPFISLNPVEPTASLPLLIFQFSISPYKNWQQLAWTASLSLIISIFLLNVFAEILSKKK